ncbi:MAG: CCE_0567 family metalloprotein [bacterium]|nr:CCE_0567 family metalloprotein [bacterium]
MSEEQKELKKELAKLRRLATDIAGQIHDIVEDSLWDKYGEMPKLSEELVARCEEVSQFKAANGL